MTFLRKNELYLTGGVDEFDMHHNDLWKFSIELKLWLKVQVYGNSEKPRARRRGTCRR